MTERLPVVVHFVLMVRGHCTELRNTAAVTDYSSSYAWHRSFYACFSDLAQEITFPVVFEQWVFFLVGRKTGPARLFERKKQFVLLGGKMSDVRLSNGSPTLERTDTRLSDHPKPSACRSLFGSVDHEELKRDLNGHLREIEEAASAKWGFDFANYTPLTNSRFEWELVDCRDVPNFYSGQTRKEKGVCSAGNSNVDLNGNHNCVVAPCADSDRSDGPMECTEQCTGRKRPACHGTRFASR